VKRKAFWEEEDLASFAAYFAAYFAEATKARKATKAKKATAD
jgi:hypothetical protein